MINEIKRERVIGYNINRLLQEGEIDRQELAVLLRCSGIHIDELLTGSVGIEEEELEKIARIFKVEPEELSQAPEKDMMGYNVHCMGEVSDIAAMSLLLDKIDLYVRLLNQGENA